MTSIACGLRPAVSYFQTECDNIIAFMEKKLLLNNINSCLEIILYRKKVVIL